MKKLLLGTLLLISMASCANKAPDLKPTQSAEREDTFAVRGGTTSWDVACSSNCTEKEAKASAKELAEMKANTVCKNANAKDVKILSLNVFKVNQALVAQTSYQAEATAKCIF